MAISTKKILCSLLRRFQIRNAKQNEDKMNKKNPDKLRSYGCTMLSPLNKVIQAGVS